LFPGRINLKYRNSVVFHSSIDAPHPQQLKLDRSLHGIRSMVTA
jgi:hypothetical protein